LHRWWGKSGFSNLKKILILVQQFRNRTEADSENMNILSLCRHQQKDDIPSLKMSFSLNYRTFPIYRGLEQLSSWSCWRVMAIYNMGVIYPGSALVGEEMFNNVWFLAHIFGSRYATKPTKGSKDSNDNLVSNKILNQDIDLLDWHLGPGKIGPKIKKTLLTSPPEKLKLETKKIFLQSQLEDVPNP